MKDYGDDVRIDKEWGQWGKDAVRKARDDKMRGRSPPPKESKGPSDRMCEGGPWGGASDGSTRGWGSPRGCSPDPVRVWRQTPKIRCHDSYWWLSCYCRNEIY